MNFSKLDAFMKKMPERGIPGCELSVTVDGKQVYRVGVGYADTEKTKPVSNSDLYWLYSATKVITCLGAMRLVEEGKLNLDDPVSKYLPEFGNVTVLRADGSVTPAENVMTIEHIFTMTGGLDYDITKAPIRAAIEKGGNTREIVRAMAESPLCFEPGSHYKYSLCHDVLGAVIEEIAGMSFGEYLNKSFFEPLGITDMGFAPTAEQEERIVAMYKFHDGMGYAEPIPCKNGYRMTDRYESGGAGLFGSVDEYMKIVTPIACGGVAENGYRLLKPETIALLGENHLHEVAMEDMISHQFGYGFGLFGRAHVNPTYSLSPTPVGEFGWGSATGHHVIIDPINRLALHYAMHIKGSNYCSRKSTPKIRDLVYEGLTLD